MKFAFRNFDEELLNGGHGAEAGGIPEFFQRRQVGKGGLRPQEGHSQGRLDLPGGGDDFPEDVAERRVAQGPGVQVQDVGHHLLFPPEIQGAGPLLVFDAADGLGQGQTDGDCVGEHDEIAAVLAQHVDGCQRTGRETCTRGRISSTCSPGISEMNRDGWEKLSMPCRRRCRKTVFPCCVRR